jgi:uncharacterized protein (TIRG00374 family)
MTESQKADPTAPGAERTSPARTLVKKLLGYGIAAACLIWVFHDVKFSELTAHMRTILWGWVAVAIVCDVLSYVSQGFRWKMLLRPTGDISIIRTTQAIYVGLFTNEIVPLRVGEIVRMFLVSRWLKTEFVSILPSYMVERMLDAIWLALAVGLVALFVTLPHELIVGEEVLGVIIIILTAVFAFAVVKKERAAPDEGRINSPRGKGPFRFVVRLIDEMAGGLRKIGLSRDFFVAAGGSIGILVFQILAFWLIMIAMKIPLTVWQGAVALLIVHMGTAIPNAPSNVGSYQFFTVVALAIFGVDKTLAASFSVVAFLLLTIPLWAIGLVALWGTGMSFSTLRAEVSKLRGMRGVVRDRGTSDARRPVS